MADQLLAPFDSDVLEDFRREIEVDVETWSAAGSSRRTTIWIVVVDGVPFIRSWKGETGKWYRDMRVEPHGAVIVGGQRVPVQAVPVDDAETIAAVSDALRTKYARDPSTPSMVTPEVERTTCRLVPDG